MRHAAVLSALALVSSLGCASGGPGSFGPARFSTDWEDDHGASIARVWHRVGGATIPAAADVAIGVAGNTDKLIGLPLPHGTRWTFAHPLDARPVVTGGVVVASGGGEVFVLDAATGGVLWRRPTGGIPLLGAGDDGTVTVVAFRKAGEAGSVLLAVTHDGQVVQQLETDRPLGAPAVLGRLAFVPWSGQYVSVIDLATGGELARVTLREQTSHAWTQSGSLWFGEAGYVRFDERIQGASQGKATRLMLPARPLPGVPRLLQPGSTPVAPVADAEDKVRVYARPTGTDAGAALSDGRWYATYFRVALGLDGDQGKLAWAHLGAADFVGGFAASDGGVVLCDEQGKIVELDAKSGGLVLEADLGEPVKACVVGADGLRPGAAPVEVRPLAQQLAAIVTSDDPQLAAAQKLLLHELATAEDPVATKALVDLASDPRTSPDLLGDARAALANRRNGASAMESALARRYDYMKDVLRPPPIGPDRAGARGDEGDRRGAPARGAPARRGRAQDDDDQAGRGRPRGPRGPRAAAGAAADSSASTGPARRATTWRRPSAAWARRSPGSATRRASRTPPGTARPCRSRARASRPSSRRCRLPSRRRSERRAPSRAHATRRDTLPARELAAADALEGATARRSCSRTCTTTSCGCRGWRFFAYASAAWLGVNVAFRAALRGGAGGCVSNAAPGLEDAFYFSVQTLATIGYGAMSPATRFGHAVVVLEALVGTLGVALVTGATFAKFARPTARVLFGAKAVVQTRDGVPHLVFRLANWRGNMVVEGQLRALVLRRQVTREGEVTRVPVDLPLVRDRTALFALTWVPMHRIDRGSPFWGPDALEILRQERAEIHLSFTGLDETIGQPIHARRIYALDDIVYNARFVDVLTIEPDGSRTIDYVTFHDIEMLGPAEALPWGEEAS